MSTDNPNFVGIPEVRTQTITGFVLRSGIVVPEARLGYCVYGNLQNPILVLHTAVSGNPRVFSSEKIAYGDGWWNRHLGEGKLFDLNKNSVICVSHFGGNGPSSAAHELDVYKDNISIVDTCHLTVTVLKKIGIHKIHAAIGVSMGGAIAREWLFQDLIELSGIVEVFANFGNNFYGSPAKNYCHIQIDLLRSDGSNLDEIKMRIEENCAPMKIETEAFALAYDHIMAEFETLYSDFSDSNVLRVTRMIGFFRFVSPYFFQLKWDEYFNESQDEEYARKELFAYCDNLGSSFIKTFKRSSLASLRYMDAQPRPYEPKSVAKRLIERNVATLGLIVRGDRLYNPIYQLDYYCQIKKVLLAGGFDLLKIYLCSDFLRGHDHFLTPEFHAQASVIKTFLERLQ